MVITPDCDLHDIHNDLLAEYDYKDCVSPPTPPGVRSPRPVVVPDVVNHDPDPNSVHFEETGWKNHR